MTSTFTNRDHHWLDCSCGCLLFPLHSQLTGELFKKHNIYRHRNNSNLESTRTHLMHSKYTRNSLPSTHKVLKEHTKIAHWPIVHKSLKQIVSKRLFQLMHTVFQVLSTLSFGQFEGIYHWIDFKIHKPSSAIASQSISRARKSWQNQSQVAVNENYAKLEYSNSVHS